MQRKRYQKYIFIIITTFLVLIIPFTYIYISYHYCTKAWHYNNNDFLPEYPVSQQENQKLEQSFLKYGWRPYSNNVLSHKNYYPKVVIKKKYSTGALGFRKCSYPSSQAAPKHYIFIGGSNTFGQGLEDNQTLPCLFQQKNPNSEVQNFGFPSFGPNNILAMLNWEKNWSNIIRSQEGYMIYIFYPFHISRAVGDRSVLKWSGLKMPYFSFRNKKLHYEGNFAKRWWSLENIHALFFCWNSWNCNNKKQYFRENSIELTSAIINSIKGQYLSSFPAGHFIVYLIGFDPDNMKQILTHLNRHHIETIQAQTLPKETVFLPDGHHSEAVNRIIVDQVSKYLFKQN